LRGAVTCSFQEEIAFAGVAGQGCGAFELDASFVEAVEFFEEVAALRSSSQASISISIMKSYF